MDLLKKLTSYICQNYKHISENVVRLEEYKKALKGIHAILSSCNDNTLTSACERINNLVKLVDEHLNSNEEKIGPMISEGYTSETVEDLEALYIQTNNWILKTASFKEEMIHHIRCAHVVITHQCVAEDKDLITFYMNDLAKTMKSFVEMLKTWNVQTSQDDDIYCCFALASLFESTVEELDENARECLKISHWFFFDTFYYWRWRHTTHENILDVWNPEKHFKGEDRCVIKGGQDLYRYLCENAFSLGDRINDVHTLDLYGYDGEHSDFNLHDVDDDDDDDDIDTNVLSRVYKLSLERSNIISDVSALGNVHTLNLSRCQGVKDVSALGGVHDLDLEGCQGVSDVSALGNVHTLNLKMCHGITDVSALGDVHTLNLSMCKGVTDVSALGGVYDLNLSQCKGVTDVSKLGGVHTLNLKMCHGVTDVSMLGGVYDLNLEGCRGVSDVSMLDSVHNLNLKECQGVSDVSHLENVHNLNLSWCQGVKDVSHLGNVRELNLSFCKGVKDVSALGEVHNLNLRGCEGITDVSHLGNVHTLDLSLCEGVKDVSALGEVHNLNLEGCEGITDVSALKNVYKLNLLDCKNVVDAGKLVSSVHILTRPERPDMDIRRYLSDVHGVKWGVNTPKRTLPTNTLKPIHIITDVDSLENVHTLDLRKCRGTN